jgi:hypothetical protein
MMHDGVIRSTPNMRYSSADQVTTMGEGEADVFSSRTGMLSGGAGRAILARGSLVRVAVGSERSGFFLRLLNPGSRASDYSETASAATSQ